jgi:aminopeptidase N
VAEADFLDGMEYDGLYFLSRGFFDLYDDTPFGYLTIIAAHETAHQWWYGLVGSDQAYEPWLDEAMCTFSERLFYEHVYPDLQLSGQPVLDWWQYYRIDYYHPTGRVNASIYDYDGFRPYRDAVYLRGAELLQALRQQVGDEAFFAFLQDYVAQKAHQTATAADFFAILEMHTDQDYSALLAEYFTP